MLRFDRLLCLIGWLGLVGLAGWGAPAVALPPELQTERATLMRDGEAALAQGRAQSAVHRFERAVSLQHSADAEIALVRALMQGGQSVQAATYGAHTAGAHRQVVEGAVLYAWLLDLSGQPVAARRLLDDASARFPGDAQVAALRAGTPDQVSVRLRPFAVGVAVPAAARVVSSGTLFDAGRQALVPLAALTTSSTDSASARRPAQVWVRNGLGQAVSARVDRRLPGLGLAVLRLSPALQARSLPRALGDEAAVLPWPQPVARDPFPGSPAHVLLYPATPAVRDGAPAWPRLHPGFLGAVEGAEPGVRQLGIDTPEGWRGGPVFDAFGRWSGIALGNLSRAGTRFVPMSVLRQVLGEAGLLPVPAESTGNPPVPVPLPVEAIHEVGLRTAVQVLAIPVR